MGRILPAIETNQIAGFVEYRPLTNWEKINWNTHEDRIFFLQNVPYTDNWSRTFRLLGDIFPRSCMDCDNKEPEEGENLHLLSLDNSVSLRQLKALFTLLFQSWADSSLIKLCKWYG